jgi:hypothetical protein
VSGAIPYYPPELPFVMAGLVPAIHVFLLKSSEDVDARDKPGHDEAPKG